MRKRRNYAIAPLICAAAALAAEAACAQWDIGGAAPMRIPSLEELSLPPAPRVYVAPPPDEQAGPLGAFLNDSTLRSGDIVVTSEGAMTFRGRDSLSHRSDDFAPLDLPSASPRTRR